MKSCRDVDQIMTAYVDGEIADEETAAIDEHLALCPPCRERAEAEKAMRQVMQAKGAGLAERASSGLRARCIAVAPATFAMEERADAGVSGWRHRVVGWVPLSMAATVLLAVGAVFILGQNKQLEAAFAAQLAIDHERCFTYLEEVAEGFDQRQAEQILATDYGVDTTLPAESADFDVINVRQCLYDEGQMAHVLCEWRGHPVSLFVVPGRSDREQILEIVGHDAVIWSRDDNAYVLVSEQGPTEIRQVADYVRQFTE